MAMIRLLYFAWVRERIGRDGETIDVPDDVAHVAGLVGRLAARGGGYAQALGEIPRLRFALDEVFVGADARIGDAAELAIFPPVTGG